MEYFNKWEGKIMQIRTESNKTIDTKTLATKYEPCFCGLCGNRVGWENTEFCHPLIICDDCAADESNK